MNENVSNWHRNNISKFSKFLGFYAVFSKISMNFMDWNIETGQQGKNVLSRRLFVTVFCCFSSDNVSNWHRKWQKTQNSNFQSFYAFFDKISTVFVNSKVLRGQKETFRCPVGSFEEIIAVLYMKKSQIETENDKNPTIFQISKILCSFFPNFRRT